MRVSTLRRGRLLPLLLFLVLLVVVGSLSAGGALAATAQTESFEVRASDLGTFGGAAPAVRSPAAIVETMDSGKVLYERNAHKRRPMASTTKIMTAILVLESGVDLSTPVTVSTKAATTWEPSRWVKAGEVLTVEQLLYAMMLRSANGAAVALAENDAGSESAFAAKMNEEAAKLGMSDTHFVTANGLDATGHYSTAADMALLGRYAMKNAKFRDIVGTREYTLSIDGAKPLLLTNTNKLLQDYDWVTGIKTGVTPRADNCLVASATKGGRSVISVLLGQPDSTLRFAETKTLLQFGLNQFRRVKLVDKGVALAEAKVPYQMDGKVELVTDGAVETELSSNDVVSTKVTVERALQLPIKAGETYGHVVVSSAGDEVARVDLVASRSFPAPTLGTKLSYFWHRVGAALGIG
jgi:D-alanyl-D-alanine carboxypeptidase (penicillin-binding protein 5/6)